MTADAAAATAAIIAAWRSLAADGNRHASTFLALIEGAQSAELGAVIANRLARGLPRQLEEARSIFDATMATLEDSPRATAGAGTGGEVPDADVLAFLAKWAVARTAQADAATVEQELVELVALSGADRDTIFKAATITAQNGGKTAATVLAGWRADIVELAGLTERPCWPWELVK